MLDAINQGTEAAHASFRVTIWPLTSISQCTSHEGCWNFEDHPGLRRNASIKRPAATLTFRLSTPASPDLLPSMMTAQSAFRRTSGNSPFSSLPSTKMQGLSRTGHPRFEVVSSCTRFFPSWAEGGCATNTFHPAALLFARKRAFCATESIGRASAAPAAAFRETGERGAVQLVVIAAASPPKKKAVRKMAPRFPGSTWQKIRD